MIQQMIPGLLKRLNPEEEERLAFLDWITSLGYRDYSRDAVGTYCNGGLQAHWIGWRARSRLERQSDIHSARDLENTLAEVQRRLGEVQHLLESTRKGEPK